MRQLVEVTPDGQERPVFFWPNLLHDLRTFGVRTALYNAWEIARFVLWGEGAEEEGKEQDDGKDE